MYTTITPKTVYAPTRHDKFDSGELNGTFSNVGLITFEELRSGTKVENWKQKVQRHESASSNFSATFYDPNIFPGTRTMDYVINGIPNRPFNETFTGCYNPLTSLNHSLVYTTDMRAKALSKLYDRLLSEKTVFESVTFLGELSQTIAMLARPLQSLRQGVDKQIIRLNEEKIRLRKMPIEKRRRVWEDIVTGTYLEAVFGWAPFISDISGIAGLIKEIVNKKHPASRITSRNSFSSSEVVTGGQTHFIDTFSEWYMTAGSWNQTFDRSLKVQYTVGIDITQALNQTALNRVIDLSGFDVRSFIPSIYNVLPWSWLLDYFFTVGSFLEAKTYDQANIRWVNETVTSRTFSTLYYSSPSFSYVNNQLSVANRTLGSLAGDFGHSSLTRTDVVRTVLTEIPTTPITKTFNGLSVKKWLNIAAVAAQQRSHSDLSWLSKRGPG